MQSKEILLALLRAEVCGGALNEDFAAWLTNENLVELYGMSVEYDLAHIAGKALEKLPITGCDEILSKFKKQTLQAIYRYVKLDYDFQQVCRAFEDAQIAYLPLKGAVLRAYYPEPWMRTSCDTDILVRKEDVKAATAILTEKLNFRYDRRSGHDVAFYSTNEMHFELHHDLIEDEYAQKQDGILRQVWEHATLAEGSAYRYEMPDDLFYFYHIAHMAKHMLKGGCGIRTILDLWLLDSRVPHDAAARQALLERGGLLKAADATSKLARVWFSEEAPDEISRQFEKFLFSSGMYSDLDNRVAIRSKNGKRGVRYLLSRIFVGYKVLHGYYPILEKHRYLQPFCLLHWWFKRVFGGGGYRLALEMKAQARIAEQEENIAVSLIEKLGL